MKPDTKTRHMFYSDPKHINLAALQDSARKAAANGGYAIIHYHSLSTTCDNIKHEEFLPEGQN